MIIGVSLVWVLDFTKWVEMVAVAVAVEEVVFVVMCLRASTISFVVVVFDYGVF